MSYMYAYDLVVTTTKSEQLPDGSFITTKNDEVVSKCRHSIKTNREFKTEEMKIIASSYIIYSPLTNLEALNSLKIGQSVKVVDVNGDELAKGFILGKNKGYFNFRLWL